MKEKVIVFENPKEFWEKVASYLLKDPATNGLFLGVSYALRDQTKSNLYQSALFQNNVFRGALINTPYYSLNQLIPSPIDEIETAKALYDELQTRSPKIDGIVAEVKTANLYKSLLEKEGKEVHTQMTQGIYRCKRVILPEISDAIQFRQANESDIPLVGQWIEDFHQEAVPQDPPCNGAEVAKTKIDSGMIYFITKDKKPISMAAWTRDIDTSCSVNLVFTPKALRRQGFASAVTALLTEKLLKNGKSETNLYTDMTNPTSNKIYQNIGYEFVCNSAHYRIENS